MCEGRWSVRCYGRASGQRRRCRSEPHAAISRLWAPADPAAAREIRTGRLRTLRRVGRRWREELANKPVNDIKKVGPYSSCPD
ncbi:hypothetical protein AV530_007682 [Patagioenas fasciata monilis]|uniref:Uncharacterized protein n=1 Tax=Patagioenas fasciata monilis TaxID=372326 RepID=A0A1V4JYX1_PATFA|nr:hypothetical protein AV530_007682 [Patagioenas fasciata monilis]